MWILYYRVIYPQAIQRNVSENVQNLLYQILMYLIRAETILIKGAGNSDVNTGRESLLTAAASPNDCMQDNTDGLKLPAVWIRDLR